MVAMFIQLLGIYTNVWIVKFASFVKNVLTRKDQKCVISNMKFRILHQMVSYAISYIHCINIRYSHLISHTGKYQTICITEFEDGEGAIDYVFHLNLSDTFNGQRWWIEKNSLYSIFYNEDGKWAIGYLNSTLYLSINDKCAFPPVTLNGWNTKNILHSDNELINIFIRDANDKTANECIGEMKTLKFLAQSSKQQHLLKHPVIMSFLWLKWHKINWIYRANQRFTVLFTYITTRFIFENCGLARSRKNFYTIVLSQIFLIFLVLNLIISIIKEFCRCLSGVSFIYLICLTIEAVVMIGCPVLIIIFEFMSWDLRLNLFLFAFTVILTFRELVQLILGMKKYVTNISNWIEILLIALTYSIMSIYDGGLIKFILSEQSQNYDLDKTEYHQIISGFIIILSWAELFSLATKHPELSR